MTKRKSLKTSRIDDARLAARALNASLAAEPLEGNIERQGATLSEIPDALIVALPRYAKIKAIVLIIEPHAQPHRLEPVGVGSSGSSRLLVRSNTVAANSDQYWQELDPPGEAHFLLVAQILDVGADVAVEAQVAELDVGLVGAERQVDLVAADREIVLVDAVAVGDVDEPAVAQPGAADDVGQAVGEPGAVGKDARRAGDAEALPDDRSGSTTVRGRADIRAP